MVGTTVNAVVLQRGLRGAGSGSRCGEADPEQYHAERKNPKWPARDPVARKRGNAFKSFEKNTKWTARDPVARKRGNAFKSFEKNTRWTVRDPVARKRGNAFKSFEKNPKMVRILGHLLFRRLRKLRLRCVGVGSALKKVN